MSQFKQRKESILSKEDKSAKGSWDKKIISLCEKINSCKEYYTTSSCAGKCVIMEDKTGKDGSYYLWVSHDLISFGELVGAIVSAIHPPQISVPPAHPDGVEKRKEKIKLKFKQEGPIIHVACENLDSAQKLVDLAREIGFKRSGIISVDKLIIELSSPEKIEFPLVSELSDEFLKVVVEEANRKLEIGWKKIKKLEMVI